MPMRSASAFMLSAASRVALAMVISISPGLPRMSLLLMDTMRAQNSMPCSPSIACTSLPGM